MCSSPKLIAAYHVLHRLLESRHPPCALICFKKITKSTCNNSSPFTENLLDTSLLPDFHTSQHVLSISLIIVITRHYNFFSQYVKELVATSLNRNRLLPKLVAPDDVLDSNQEIPLYYYMEPHPFNKPLKNFLSSL